MIEVELPDGTILEFPEGTSQDVMRGAIMKMQGGAKALNPQQEYMAARARGEMPAPVPMDNVRATGQRAIDAQVNLAVRQSQADEARAAATAGQLGAALLGASQGATFGLSDEIIAGLSALSPSQTYAEELPKVRQMMTAAQEENPITSTVATIGGAIPVSLAAGAAAGLGKAGAGLGARAMQGAALGAGEGALYGFGTGEGVGDRLSQAVMYGAVGGAIGGAAPLAITGARQGFDALVAGPLAAMRKAPSPTRAGAAILEAANRAGMSVDDINNALAKAAQEGQPEVMAADVMGRSGQRLLSSVARQPTDMQAEIVNALTSRQAAQWERLSRVIADALDAPVTAAAKETALKQARSEAADIAYRAARRGAGPVDVRGVIAAIDDRIGPMSGSNIAGDGIDGAFNKFRNRLMAKPAPSGELSRELSDFDRVLGVKQDVQDAIGAAVENKQNNKARELTGLVNQLDQALEAASDGYRAANDQFAQASRVIDQIEAGKGSASPLQHSPDVLAQYGRLAPDEQSAFRTGRADVTLARIKNAPEGANKVRPLTSGKAQTELPAMAKDGDLLLRQLGRENAMFETGRKVLGGSETAERLADDEQLAAMSTGVLGNILGGRFGMAAQQAGGMAGNALMGRNTATREQIARALMSDSISQFVQPALKKQAATVSRDRLLEALMRAGGRGAMGATE